MARFRFELEPLLEQRRREEKERMKAVAEIERERLEVERRARELAAILRDERRHWRDELGRGGAVDLTRVRLQAGASVHGVRRTNELAIHGAAVMRRLHTARTALAEATTKRRAVELLRQRRYEAWLADQRRREARELDEILTGRFSAPAAESEAAS